MRSEVVPKVGVYLPQVSSDFESVFNVACRAEELGFHSVWLSDHMMPLMEERPFLESWTALSAVASRTKTLKLGTIVMCNSFRHPSLLAKMSATLDVLSNGRLILGMGAGYIEKEYRAYGFPFPTASERIEQLSESLRILKLMWTQRLASFQGKYYSIQNAICEPKPVQRPHPPILVGGTGKRISRVIAELADYCNLDRLTVEESVVFLRRLSGICEDAGRPPWEVKASLCSDVYIGSSDEEIAKKVDLGYERFISMAQHAKNDNIGLYVDRFRPCTKEEYLERRISGTPDQCIDRIAQYVKIGINVFVLVFPDITGVEVLRFFRDRVLKYFEESEA